MNAPVTRRALLSATAALGATALPAIAEAGIAAAVADHPDAELLRLLRAWGPARAAADLAGERSDALWNDYIDQEPARPQALTYRGDDGLNCGFEVEILPNKRRVAFYGLAEIGRLMSQPLPSYRAWRGGPAPWSKGEEVGRWVQVPAERAIARRAEVEAAHQPGWPSAGSSRIGST